MDSKKTLALNEQGDIFFDNLGKLAFIDFETKIIQTIKMKLSTLRGELFYDDKYGIKLFNKVKINKEYLEAAIRDAIVDGKDIIDARMITYKRNATNYNAYDVTLEIYLFNGSTLRTIPEDNIQVGV